MLETGLKTSMDTTLNIIVATPVLHNVARKDANEEEFPDQNGENEIDETDGNGHYAAPPEGNFALGNVVRNAIIQQNFTE